MNTRPYSLIGSNGPDLTNCRRRGIGQRGLFLLEEDGVRLDAVRNGFASVSERDIQELPLLVKLPQMSGML